MLSLVYRILKCQPNLSAVKVELSNLSEVKGEPKNLDFKGCT